MSDHFSGPAALADPSVDITDLYAFPSPERAGNLVLIMDVFPMATPNAFFSDVVTHRFRLRPVTPSDDGFAYGTTEHTIDVRFGGATEGTSVQAVKVVTADGREARSVTGTPGEQDGLRVFAGLASDPFYMDVEAAVRTDLSGELSFDTAVNTAEDRDVLAIVVETPAAPIVERLGGTTMIAVVAETLVAHRGAPIRLERVGRPEIKNVVMANPMRARLGAGVELRDLYNREDAFALSPVYRPLYEARLDANLAFLDGLDGATAWPQGAGGRHPLRDLLLDDFLVLDVARAFAPGGFLEIERAVLAGRPHLTAGGRWLDDDILDELLTLLVSGIRGQRFGDGVEAPTRPAALRFPYVREPNERADLPLPAFLRS